MIRIDDIIYYPNVMNALVYEIHSHQSLGYLVHSLLLRYLLAPDVPQLQWYVFVTVQYPPRTISLHLLYCA